MKLIKYLFVALVLGAFSSCSDYLDKQPDDMLTLEMVFNDKTRTEDWLAGCYSSIPDQNAFWPRLSSSRNANNTQESTWWLHDMSMLRLKNVELGYNFSKKK